MRHARHAVAGGGAKLALVDYDTVACAMLAMLAMPLMAGRRDGNNRHTGLDPCHICYSCLFTLFSRDLFRRSAVCSQTCTPSFIIVKLAWKVHDAIAFAMIAMQLPAKGGVGSKLLNRLFC